MSAALLILLLASPPALGQYHTHGSWDPSAGQAARQREAEEARRQEQTARQREGDERQEREYEKAQAQKLADYRREVEARDAEFLDGVKDVLGEGRNIVRDHVLEEGAKKAAEKSVHVAQELVAKEGTSVMSDATAKLLEHMAASAAGDAVTLGGFLADSTPIAGDTDWEQAQRARSVEFQKQQDNERQQAERQEADKKLYAAIEAAAEDRKSDDGKPHSLSDLIESQKSKSPAATHAPPAGVPHHE
jgi:hypothetical protein